MRRSWLRDPRTARLAIALPTSWTVGAHPGQSSGPSGATGLRGTVPGVNSVRHQDLTSACFDAAFVVEVPFAFVSKSNFRRARASGSWATNRSFEDSVAVLVRSARPAMWLTDQPTAPLASRSIVVVSLYARTTLDAANLSKSVLDAAEGLLYVNDAQVAYCSALATRARAEQRGYVAAAQVRAHSDPDVVLAAGHALDLAARDWWTSLVE